MKQIIVRCDLGKWRLVKCKGTFEKGFRPIEDVPIDPPDRVKTLRNNKYYNDTWGRDYAYGVHGVVGRKGLSASFFPFPQHETDRRTGQKQALRRP